MAKGRVVPAIMALLRKQPQVPASSKTGTSA